MKIMLMITRSSSLLFCLLPLLLLAVNDTAEAASAKNRVSATKTSAIRGPKVTVDDAEKYVVTANEALRVQKNAIGLASWAQSSDITPENDQAYIEASQRYDEFSKAQFNEVKAYFDLFPQLSDFTRRQLEKMGIIGTSALTKADASTFSRSSLEMKKVYSTARITAGGRPNLELEPDLTEILANSSDEKLLREDYITYYTLGNKAARLNSLPGKDFRTYDDLWMAEWETADMKAQVDKLMEETMPLYQKIHAYVRYHLKEKYGDGVMPADGTIPAHLLGNMWAQQWGNLLNIIPEMNPNPEMKPIDTKVNEKLQTWTVKKMFELSEKFFADLGMQKMTDTFWKKSILVKPTDRNLTCHASAWDFYDASKTDFRIKQCTEKTMSDLVTVHHEMGHIQYYMNYVVQPPIYRRGANPGFHEAIGDLIALAVATPQHLVKVDLLEPIPPADVEKINLNYQMKMALDKVAFLPFAYVMDKWRWDVFGEVATTETAMNRRWWEYRLQYQGLSPPVADRKRNERDFDPGAKYHIPAGVEYVRYFASHVLQFQFYERMCKTVAGITEQNLYTCDFDGNKEAGAALMAMLAQGSSRSWPDILESFIGSRTMSLGSLNKYFKPLNDYLDKFIADKGIKVGWSAKVEDYVEPMNAADFSGRCK
ncbi:hypothetical protein TYRP_003196 [Tyrophagus putrescentiae]|nr:hypothetical protein TYRP_003196 [Tyrophagus putrescentiae]